MNVTGQEAKKKDRESTKKARIKTGQRYDTKRIPVPLLKAPFFCRDKGLVIFTTGGSTR